MAGRYGRKYAKEEDFEEGEIWGLTMEDNNKNSSPNKLRKPMKDSSFFTTSLPSPRNFTAPRMIPRKSSEINNNNKQSSAPLEIPDWSKIYGKTNKKKNGNNGDQHDDGYYYTNGMLSDHQNNHYGNNGHYGHDNDHHDDGSEEDDDDDINGVVPPHEYIARKLARNQISSFSVYEGIGRTLKGRDLSKVRNTILSKTGFLE